MKSLQYVITTQITTQNEVHYNSSNISHRTLTMSLKEEQLVSPHNLEQKT